MRKVVLIALSLVLMFTTTAFAVTFVTAQTPGGKTITVPAHAKELAPGLLDLGTAVVDGELVQGYMFIDYKKDFSHKPQHGGNGGTTTCFAFLANGAKWKTTEQYVLDTANSDGLSSAFVDSSFAASIDAWDNQVAFDIFDTRNTATAVDGADTVAPDGKNEVFFGSVSEPGAIAVTIVWGIFSGPTFQRKLVEFDMVFDDPDFAWGDATLNLTVMDFQNIAAHESGHAAGMAHPGDACTEETMYRFASAGETKKRDMNTGDIAGIKKFYG